MLKRETLSIPERVLEMIKKKYGLEDLDEFKLKLCWVTSGSHLLDELISNTRKSVVRDLPQLLEG